MPEHVVTTAMAGELRHSMACSMNGILVVRVARLRVADLSGMGQSIGCFAST